MANFTWTMMKTSSRRGLLWNVCCPFRLFGRSVRSFSSSSVVAIEMMSSLSPPSPVPSSGLYPSSPWLMLPSEVDKATGGEKLDCFYSPIDRQVVKLNRKKSLRVPNDAKCVGSTRGWLGFIDPKDCSLYLSNPFSLLPHQHPHSPHVIQLPLVETLPNVVGVIRNPKSNAIEKFHLKYDDAASYTDGEGHFLCPFGLSASSIIQHLAMSSDPFNEEKDCLLMAEYGPGDPCHIKLAFCRLGKDTAWTGLAGPVPTCSQFAYSKKEKLFYRIFGRGGIQAWDVNNPCRPAKRITILLERDAGEVVKDGFFMHQYLVDDESLGDILLVNRHCARFVVTEDGTFMDKNPNKAYARFIPEDGELCDTPPPYKTLGFDVYKLNGAEKKIERLKCLGDRAIFLGLKSNSFSLSASEFPELRANSIYLTDCYFEPMLYGQYPDRGSDLGIFNLEDESIMRCCEDLKKSQMRASLLWVAPSNSC